MLQSTVKIEGESAFHLAHPDFLSHRLTSTVTFQVSEGMTLYFFSLLRYATSYQIAKLQVSANEGTWTTLWSRAGDDGAGQGAFERVSIPLADYAGQRLRLRLNYEFTGVSAYTGITSDQGWFVDDIQVGTAFEGQQYDAFGDPDAKEILSVELINRARAHTGDEVARLMATSDPDVLFAVGYFDVDFQVMASQFATLPLSLPPLAINGALTEAARLHSEDMLIHVFQSHISSSNPPPPNEAFDGIDDRFNRQGYFYQNAAENIFAYAENVGHAHSGFNIDWGGGAATGGMQDPPGHRLNIHSAVFREIGVGIVEGSNGLELTGVGPMVITQDFGTSSQSDSPFLVGVTHVDADRDQFYDPGEGVGGVDIRVEGAYFRAVSSSQGAYAIPLPGNGDYTVTFTKAGYSPVTQAFSITQNASHKVDYRAQPRMELTAAFDPAHPGFRIRSDRALSKLAVEYTVNFAAWLPATEVTLHDLGDDVFLDLSAMSVPAIAFRLVILP